VLNAGCASDQYSGWQTINITGCGELKIPDEWIYYESNGLIYITDSNQTPIMIESRSYPNVATGTPGSTESNDFFENVTNLKYLAGVGLSNGAYYGKVLVGKGSMQSEHYCLDIGYDRTVQLVFWAETIDEAMVKRIAKSFVSE
jgi:hypothetical protein